MLWVYVLFLGYVNGLPNPYDPAAQCSKDLLQKYPTLPSEWIFSNGTFGGRETSLYVGWIDHWDSSMPYINMMDGPQGVRDILVAIDFKNRTSWPAASVYGLAWSPELAFYGGKFGASDWHAVNANVALTPGVNVHRVPIGGRNWEYVSGEDAYLGTLAASLVHGLQSSGLMGSLKHFALNNQELARASVISSIDEATLMESYLRAFQPAIDAGIGSVMCSYNQIQVDEDNVLHSGGSYAYACGSFVLSHFLRDIMGFKGTWMTDWNAEVTNTTNKTEIFQRQYVDWEMRWGSDINVIIPKKSYEQIISNTLTGMFASGILKNDSVPSCNLPGVKVPTIKPNIHDLPAHYRNVINDGDIGEFSAILVAEAMVLLKNSPDVLPLRKKVNQRILLTGTALLNGGGSGDSSAFGYYSPDHKGEGLFNGGRMAQNVMASNIHKYTGAIVEWDFEIKELNASKYDVILAFGAQFRSEAYLVNDQDGYYNIDQCNSSMNFSSYGDCDYFEFLKKFQNVRLDSTKVIAITTTGGVHYPDYIDLVDAAITVMYPGQYFSLALSKVLSGEISPGGKLTYTLPDLEDDKKHIQSPIGRFNRGLRYKNSKELNTLEYPAFLWDHKNHKASNIIQYSSNISIYAEKNLVGYKYYEKYDMVPLFPFGFGLSYANYKVTPDFNLCKSHALCEINVRVHLDNHDSPKYIGIASEVIQVYVGYRTEDPDKFLPVKELRAFRKVWHEGMYSFRLKEDAFKTSWNVEVQEWDWPCAFYVGYYNVSVGTSSSNILGSIRLSC